MSTLFLSDEELHELTGYELASYQAAWLKKRGWRFEPNAAGKPRVARAHFERKMGCEAATPEPPLPAKHNFGALRVVK